MKPWQPKQDSLVNHDREILMDGLLMKDCQTAVALEMRIHMMESPESSRHHVKPPVVTLWQWKPMKKQHHYSPRIIKTEDLIVQRK